mgnify:CR=1 FL=1
MGAFQSLIGRLRTEHAQEVVQVWAEFQSLIGRLRTTHVLPQDIVAIAVSIPYR